MTAAEHAYLEIDSTAMLCSVCVWHHVLALVLHPQVQSGAGSICGLLPLPLRTQQQLHHAAAGHTARLRQLQSHRRRLLCTVQQLAAAAAALHRANPGGADGAACSVQPAGAAAAY